MKNKTIAIAAFVLLVVSAVSTAQEAQELDSLLIRPDTPEFEQDVTVTLQLIDVVVTDRDGNYVKNLNKDDFIIRVNGEPVTIRTFDAYFRGQRGGIEDMAAGDIPDAIAPSRRLILFFDQAYTSFNGLRKAKAAAIEFVRRNMSPGDQMMVIGYERSFKIYQEFTRDREMLEDAIERIKFAMVSGNRPNVYFETENVFNVRLYLQTMEKLALLLKSYRGRKTMIMMSEGFDQRLAFTTLAMYQKDMLEQFNDANTSIYTIDVAGLSVPGAGGTSAVFESNRTRYRHDSLSIFANETGGSFYRGNNNIEELLLSIDDDVSNYYVLGFYTPDYQDGKFREVDVEVKEAGYRVQHRRGFFANKPFEKMSGDEKIISLEEGFHRTVPIREFPVKFATQIFPRNDGSAVATIVIEAPITETGKQRFELLGYVYNLDEETVDVFHKRFYFDSTHGSNTFYHMQTANLESGENLIKMVLRDNVTGKRCYNFVNAKMPLLGEGLHASTIALLDDSGPKLLGSRANVKNLKRDYREVPQSEPADPLSPLTRSGIRISAANTIKRGNTVGLVLKISGIDSSSGEPQLTGSFRLRDKNGERIDLAVKDFSVMPVPGSGEIIVRADVAFDDILPGEYTLSAEIEDKVNESLVGQRAEITVM